MELVLAIVSPIVAALSALVAGLSWVASRSSANAAQRSAAAAEESLEIQKREAQAAEELRRLDQIADVIPLHWDGRSGQQHRGLVIRNNGPAIAQGITAYEVTGAAAIRKWLWATLSVGETIGLVENELGVSDDEEAGRIGRPTGTASAYARLEWTNADGGAGLADWRPIQRRQ